MMSIAFIRGIAFLSWCTEYEVSTYFIEQSEKSTKHSKTPKNGIIGGNMSCTRKTIKQNSTVFARSTDFHQRVKNMKS